MAIGTSTFLAIGISLAGPNSPIAANRGHDRPANVLNDTGTSSAVPWAMDDWRPYGDPSPGMEAASQVLIPAGRAQAWRVETVIARWRVKPRAAAWPSQVNR